MDRRLFWNAPRLSGGLIESVRVMGWLLIVFALPFVFLGETQAVQPSPPSLGYQRILLEIQDHVERNDLDGAQTLLTSASRSYPLNGGLENLQGVVDIQQGHTDLAREQFALAIRHEPKLAGAYLNLARIDMQKAASDLKERAAAAGLYHRLLTFEPHNGEAHYQLATIEFWNHRYQNSIDDLNQLSEQDREAVGAEVLTCSDLAELGKASELDLSVARLVVNHDLVEQDGVDVLSSLQHAHRADLIEQIFSAINLLHPLLPSGLRTLGLAQEATGKLKESRANLEAAFSSGNNPASVSTSLLIDLTRVAKAEQDYQGALGYLAHARELSPTDASLPYEFGAICLKLGLVGEARNALAAAVKLAPENAEYNLGMGIVSSFAQDATLARPYLEKVHVLEPSNPTPVLALGTMYFRAKNFDDARKWLTMASNNPATGSDAYYYLGRIARQEGDLEEAAKDLHKSDALKPDNADVFAELGQVSISTHNYPEAQACLDRALQLDKDNYTANYALMQLYARLGDPRRDAQSTRFDEIKAQSEEHYKEMMRIIEVRPNGELAK